MRCSRTGILLLGFLLSISFLRCSRHHSEEPSPQQYHDIDSLNALLMKELRTKPVVMFSDARPGHIAYAECLTSFLNSWIDQLRLNVADSALPRKITLVLEMGSAAEKVLDAYVKRGDRYALLRFFIDEKMKLGSNAYSSRSLSTDFLQFCEELRLLNGRIDSLNTVIPALRVSLRLLGPESEPPYNFEDLRRSTRNEFLRMQNEWLMTQRDCQSSACINRFLNDHPDEKLLVFYPAIHMVRSTEFFYSMTHHLDSLLGRSRVAVFQTTFQPRNPSAARKVVIDPQKAIEEFSHTGERSDYIVRKEPAPKFPFPFFLVKSQNTFGALVDLAEGYEASADSVQRDLARSMLGLALEQLRHSHLALHPACSQEIAALQRTVTTARRTAIMAPDLYTHVRRLISQFDAVRDVFAIDSVMVTFTPSIDFYNTLTTVVQNLPGVLPAPSDSISIASPAEQGDTIMTAWAKTWKQQKTERLTYMLDQILWIGTPGEVESAMRALKVITKKNFDTPMEWDFWRRSTLWREASSASISPKSVSEPDNRN